MYKDPKNKDWTRNIAQEVFPEAQSQENASIESREIQDHFENTNECKKLRSIIPSKLDVWEHECPLVTNIALCDRIVSNYTKFKRSEAWVALSFEKYASSFWWHTFDSVSEDSKEQILIQLAIIEASHDPTIIALDENDSNKLCQLILDELSLSISYTQEKDIETNETQVSFIDDPAYPILFRLLDEWIIDSQDFRALNQIYIRDWGFHDLAEIPKHTVIEPYLLLWLSEEAGTQRKNQEKFQKDFPNSGIEIFPWMNIQEHIRTQANILTSKNYINITKKDGSIDIEADLSVAIQVAAKRLLKNNYSINRKSETFAVAIHNLASPDTRVQEKWLQALVYLQWIQLWIYEKVWQQNFTQIEQLLRKNHQLWEEKQVEKQKKVQSIQQAEKIDNQWEKQAETPQNNWEDAYSNDTEIANLDIQAGDIPYHDSETIWADSQIVWDREKGAD